MTAFNKDDDQGIKKIVSNNDVVIESDRDQDGVGDFVVRTGGVERTRVKADGTGSSPPSTITITNPATAGLTIVPASGQTADVLVINAGSHAVAAGTSLDLVHLTAHNTGPATGDLYNIRLDTNCDNVDTGAAIAIVNTGNADCIYLNAQGAAGTATTPTGIGLDMNKATSTTENSSTYAGYGLQIWDFSTTNIGAPSVGPTGIFLLKKNNPDTDHVMLYIRANRKAIRLTIPDTGSGGYSATQPIFEVTDNSGNDLYSIQAQGNAIFANTLGVFFTGTSGAQAHIVLNSSNQLDILGGVGVNGVRFLNNAGTQTNLIIQDAGSLVLFDGGNIGLGTTTGTKIGTASTQKLGFYGATAIVRPSAVGAATGYAAGTTAVTFHSDDTYTGNVGSTAYTLNGIVAALKNLGLIAS